ncbi:hypothetical protein ACES2L_10070 [Bdellovibrio bacteriovorus]
MPKSWGLFLSALLFSFNTHAVEADSPVINPPHRDKNPHGIKPSRCSWVQEGNYEECNYLDNSGPVRFLFRNYGPNRIVSKAPSRSREWSFNYAGNARQDLSFSVTDMPNGTVSLTQESIFHLFPRKTLPHIRTEDNKHYVTLPTGEVVVFNAQTKEVVGGVITEDGPMTSGVRALAPAKITYKGTGVMVRANQRGADPRLGNSTAKITKGSKSCQVQLKELWPDQNQDSAVHFRFATDAEFDSFLKRRCGFGI